MPLATAPAASSTISANDSGLYFMRPFARSGTAAPAAAGCAALRHQSPRGRLLLVLLLLLLQPLVEALLTVLLLLLHPPWSCAAPGARGARPPRWAAPAAHAGRVAALAPHWP